MAVLLEPVHPAAGRLRRRRLFKTGLSHELTHLCGDFVAHSAKDAASLNWICLSGRIGKAPVHQMAGARPRGAAFFGTVANGDDVIERLPYERRD